MGVEIERKFLVRGAAWRQLGQPVRMVQGYLSSHKGRVVRVRIEGDQARLTIKGASHGATRGEWEYPIPVAEAEELLAICEQPLIDKTRTRIAQGRHVWEVDEFFGANAGLVVAEIELASEDEAFDKPDWVGTEVTGEARYANASLIHHPYSTWHS
ncbi:CYTH domain-containing protein [Massilia sp. TS11]|uniref:CYTH domain-containing protein n=1 Tax=Massilia sp. TS11 TaxID=2908003 RepID=UPI001EDA13DF|nr:CYTH domain-containing protein [Massilia sp. TS11]MCG2583087.1 CYTH domain-containing protein [Massilia sp. TS11]